MGIFAEYLDRKLAAPALNAERKKQLQRIASIRGGDVLVIAADLQKSKSPIALNGGDVLPISDQLSNLTGKTLDVILETPGGSGEAAEDIVRLIRAKYERVGVIVPGTAKSAGTIMAMAADEILMDQASALGPIDAQIQWQGKVFSADALLSGFQKIKDEVTATNVLNRAYIPMLQSISPGELQSAENALHFARDLVRDWLVLYKFRNWNVHSSTGQPVTSEERVERAQQIADKLRDHSRWKTHGRSIKIEELRKMRLLVTNYAEQADLADAIRRYYVLLRMTFESPIFKIFETPISQIYRAEAAQPGTTLGPGSGALKGAQAAHIDMECNRCGAKFQVQADFQPGGRLRAGNFRFPKDNRLQCPGAGCTEVHDLSQARKMLEGQFRAPIL